MSKYNFNISGINTETTHGKVLSKIAPNSLVLECGCANGYMTKFLRDNMGCRVHIIEINQYDYIAASQYAETSCLGDLNETHWSKHFNGNHYDYILFADVLEHLYDPVSVLCEASRLLKDDGKIVISFPNICHNDILINMFYDHWQYHTLGLLDNTHIKFIGLNDIDQMSGRAGLRIVDRDYKIVPTQFTEQKRNGPIDDNLMALLKQRPNGEVYQFVIVCERVR